MEAHSSGLPSADDLDRVAAEEAAREKTAGTSYLIDDLAEDHERNERRFEMIERRLRVVEKRGSLLPEFDQENIFFYLTIAYVVFGFVLPAIFRAFGAKDVEL